MSFFPTAAGRKPAKVQPAQHMPKPVFYMLAATLAMFIAANAFGSTITSIINVSKWGPLIALLLVSWNALTKRKVPSCPPIMLMWMGAFVLFASVSAYRGISLVNSLGSLVSVAIVVLTGYAVAAVIIATDSRRQFFDLIATLGRVLVLITMPMFLANIDLGRGGGFSAWVDNPNTLAAILAPGCIVFLAGCIERRPGWVYRHLLFLIMTIPLLAVSEGRASYLWIVMSGACFYLYRRGSVVIAFAAMIALIILIGWWEPITSSAMHWAQLDQAAKPDGTIGPLSGREEVWRIGIELFGDRPLFGYGMGSSNTLIRAQAWRFVRFQGLHFHSSYIMALVETGIFGLFILLATITTTFVRGLADARRTRMLPRELWPTSALPFAMFAGALGHALFESWLLAGGNVNSPMFWIVVWLIHFQSQVPIRKVFKSPPKPVAAPRLAIPAR